MYKTCTPEPPPYPCPIPRAARSHISASGTKTTTSGAGFPANAAQDIELVKAAIEAHAKGEIRLPALKGKGTSIHPSDYLSCQSTDEKPFTRKGLEKFLGVAGWRINITLGHLLQMKAGLTTAEDYQGLTPTQAREMKTQVAHTKSEAGVAVARKVAKKIGDAIRSSSASAGALRISFCSRS